MLQPDWRERKHFVAQTGWEGSMAVSCLEVGQYKSVRCGCDKPAECDGHRICKCKCKSIKT